MPLSQKEIRDNALQFSRDWADASRERADSQTFWNEFFDIFGIKRRRVASFEEPVKKMGNKRGSIDLFWKGTLVAEHKSRGENLDKAYGQALDYFEGLKDEELPKYVLVSDFARFRLYDLDEDIRHEFPIEDLAKNIDRFGFISGYRKRTYKDEDPVNIKVAEKMGQLHDALLDSGYDGHDLEVFLVRLVYCLFADDTGIFNAKGDFEYYLREKTKENGSDTGRAIAEIFQVLDTPHDKRHKTIDEDLARFPYVNGSLFRENLRIANFDRPMRELLLDCCLFDWSMVSPAIFGSLFQSVMDKVQRRNLGAHYTSEKNILKVIRGLFLDELYAEFDSIKTNAKKLQAFHDKIAAMRFFDPACGCGNFLVITYREMRQLEIELLRRHQTLTGNIQLEADVSVISKIDVNQVYGIEIEEFPARIAEVALWLTDHQMNMRLSEAFGQTYVRLPLRHSPNIACGNAIRLDWETLIPSKENLFILGNPPYVGSKMMNEIQRTELGEISNGIHGAGVLDYVTAWFIKAARFIDRTEVKVAFVSTNSITQGEQVGILWNELFRRYKIKIHFAHRTFKWTNEARGKAAVHVVIIGFAGIDKKEKLLYDYESPESEPHQIAVKNINPYLVDGNDTVISKRDKPLCDVPEMKFGNMPLDGGNLLLSDEEKEQLLRHEPKAEKFIKRLMGSQEFINGETRWCLWLVNAAPGELRAMPEVMKRIEAVKKFREASIAPSTRKFAATPSLFRDRNLPEHYIVVPKVSSERRVYIPMGFLNSDVVVTDLCFMIPDATLYHFGVLTSAMHMAWVRYVCGRLKSDYRYSKDIVYNNFPFPEGVTEKQRAKVEEKAKAVLSARELFPAATLADLYDPLSMPKELLKAHRELDEAVDACYRRAAFKTELERLEFLFELYRNYSEPLTQAMEKKPKRPRKSTD